jgi:hypothetical protein
MVPSIVLAVPLSWWRAVGLVLVGLWCAPLAAQPPPIPEPDELLTFPSAGLTDSILPPDQSFFRIEPYGSVRGNMYYSTSRTNPGSFTIWVFSDEVHGEPQFDLDARRSRIGTRIFAPPIELGNVEYDSHGRFEIDFFGQFLTENRATARLRHVYWQFQSETHRFLVGQTDDVISPLLPGTLNFTLGRGGGNIGFRRAQFRAERILRFDDGVSMLLQGSVNQDIVDDFPDEPGVRRETTDWPVIQARVGLSHPAFGDPGRDTTFGFSGHIGETGFDFLVEGPPPLNLPPLNDARFKTWSINLDAEIPLAPSLTLRGELFRGTNLSPFFGGIGQGVCACLRTPIHAQGGWFEVVKQWHPRWESHFGAGIDDPKNEDSLLGRVQNSFIFGNLIFQVTEEFSTGFEIAYWRTLYQERRVGMIPDELLTPSAPGKALTLDWMVRYDF